MMTRVQYVTSVPWTVSYSVNTDLHILSIHTTVSPPNFLWAIGNTHTYAFLDFKNAKISQLDAASFEKRFNYGVEGQLNDFFRLELGQTEAVGNLLDDFFLGHVPYS